MALSEIYLNGVKTPLSGDDKLLLSLIVSIGMSSYAAFHFFDESKHFSVGVLYFGVAMMVSLFIFHCLNLLYIRTYEEKIFPKINHQQKLEYLQSIDFQVDDEALGIAINKADGKIAFTQHHNNLIYIFDNWDVKSWQVENQSIIVNIKNLDFPKFSFSTQNENTIKWMDYIESIRFKY